MFFIFFPIYILISLKFESLAQFSFLNSRLLYVTVLPTSVLESLTGTSNRIKIELTSPPSALNLLLLKCSPTQLMVASSFQLRSQQHCGQFCFFIFSFNSHSSFRICYGFSFKIFPKFDYFTPCFLHHPRLSHH